MSILLVAIIDSGSTDKTNRTPKDPSLIKERVSSSIKLVQRVPLTSPSLKSFKNFTASLSIPVVSAIRGFCIGSGLELALYSHIRICGTNGMIGLPESTFGYLPGLGGTYKLASLIGYGKGSELILSGEILTAEDAYKYGIVDKVIHKNHVITYAEQLLNLIIKNEPNYSKKDALSYITKYENSIILDS